MRTTDQGIKLLKSFEGFRSKAYLDSAGVWTIGYGSTFGVKPGDVIDDAAATHLLYKEVEGFEFFLERAVKVPLTSYQWDALICFVYNIGTSAFSKSTLLKLLNAGDYRGAALQFQRWDKIRIRPSGRVVPLKGLTVRRKRERDLFVSGVY